MKKATYLGQVISYFDPMQSLDSTSFEWYVERPDSPHLELKSFLLNNQTDSKILFSGHRGSGKTSTLNKLASDPDIQQKFFLVQFSIKDELNVADLTYTDLLVAMGHRLYSEADKKTYLKEDLKKDLDEWSAEISRSRSVGDTGEVKVERTLHHQRGSLSDLLR
jgi:septin family protein